MRPKAASVRCTACCAWPSSETSARHCATRAPASDSAVDASPSVLASTSITAAPSRQKSRATAAPMPAPPPVTMATFPSRRPGISIRLRPGGLDHLAPARDLGLDPPDELLRRAGHDFELHLLELRLHRR